MPLMTLIQVKSIVNFIITKSHCTLTCRSSRCQTQHTYDHTYNCHCSQFHTAHTHHCDMIQASHRLSSSVHLHACYTLIVCCACSVVAFLGGRLPVVTVIFLRSFPASAAAAVRRASSRASPPPTTTPPVSTYLRLEMLRRVEVLARVTRAPVTQVVHARSDCVVCIHRDTLVRVSVATLILLACTTTTQELTTHL